MATVTKGKTFISGETVEPADMHQLVDSATVTFSTASDTDDSTLEVSGNKFRAKDGGITVAKLAGTLDLSSKTITLPDASVTAAKLDGAQTGSAPIYGCRAWVNFDGTAGTTVDGEFRCTIRGSGNVSKVVRTLNPGHFQITFTTPMSSANYAAVASGTHATATSRGTNFETFDTTTASFKMVVGYANAATIGQGYNPGTAHVAVFA